MNEAEGDDKERNADLNDSANPPGLEWVELFEFISMFQLKKLDSYTYECVQTQAYYMNIYIYEYNNTAMYKERLSNTNIYLYIWLDMFAEAHHHSKSEPSLESDFELVG